MVTVVLIITLLFFDGRKNSDIEDFLVYSMFLLTFPSGIIISGLMFIIFYFFMSVFSIEDIMYDVNYVYLILVWFFLFIPGYIQWFFLIPITCRKYQDKKNRYGQR
jgi:hypothetical protein